MGHTASLAKTSLTKWALLTAVAFVAATAGCGKRQGGRVILRLYSGAGLRAAAAEMVEEFERTHEVKMECDYAGTNVLLSRIKLSGEGDLYMPGDSSYVRQAESEGLISSSVDACYFVPVILVGQGNPLGIQQLTDLTRPGLRVGLGDAEACAIGRITEKILEKNGIAKDIEPHVVFRSLTVNELGVQIKAGKIDATIVWDAIARQYKDVGEIVAIPAEKNVISTVPIAVLRSSKHPKVAQSFQEFAISERGREIFARHGYTTSPPR